MVDEIFDVLEDLFERRKKKDKGKKGEKQAAPELKVPAAPPVFCIGCGARNEGAARFCLECGELLPSPGEEMKCLGCNSVVPLKAKFCPRCGSKVAV
jgi:membrane protease subunit (stomatin/prohibitin family)